MAIFLISYFSLTNCKRKRVGYVLISPDSAKTHFQIGLCQAELGYYEEALNSYDAGLRLNPSDTSALLIRANILTKLGRHAESDHCYRDAFAPKPVNQAQVSAFHLFSMDYVRSTIFR